MQSWSSSAFDTSARRADVGQSATRAAASSPAAELSVIVPTVDECQNVRILVERLEDSLRGINYEIIFVDDDSTDGTLVELHGLARVDARVRYLHRIGRRGLSSAVVEGILSTSSPYIAVVDADLQHDETLLPSMLSVLKGGQAQLVVGSRFAPSASIGGLNRTRTWMSRFARRLSRLAYRSDLSDPMSGFFMITRAAFDRSLRRLSLHGYKILFDILASSPEPVPTVELPYTFAVRERGRSKLDTLVVWEYVTLILDKLMGQIVPPQFLMFGLVGGVGMLIHMVMLWLTYQIVDLTFATAQLTATLVAMTSNFFLNNLFTFRDRRLRGWAVVRGLAAFYVICSISVLANVGVASVFFEQKYTWWVAGAAGAIIGAVWNYAASSAYTWGRRPAGI